MPRLATELLAQADFLARKEPENPRDASLRRAVSAAYYALFHRLVDDTCRLLLGGSSRTIGLRAVLARGFNHSAMKKASQAFETGRPPASIVTVIPDLQVSAELKTIAATFVASQEARHEADYNPVVGPMRMQVNVILSRVRQSMEDWDRIRKQTDAQLYMLCLLFWDELRGR